MFLHDIQGEPNLQSCEMSYSQPQYYKIDLPKTFTKKKNINYSVYLYREYGIDKNTLAGQLNGIPLIFIPGNRGSFKQVRSIASETSRLYYNKFHKKNLFEKNEKIKYYDFFTFDNNEEFAAFNGQSVIDQAFFLNDVIKLILSFYSTNKVIPQSVLLIGHSIGGITCKLAVTLPNYNFKSINTIITLASPHFKMPIYFDKTMYLIYKKIENYWFEGYHHKLNYLNQSDFEKSTILKNISLISISGGFADKLVSDEYLMVNPLIPFSNGITAYSTGIPKVWTSIDHSAIVWCLNLRKIIAKILLNIADYSSPSKTLPLEKRMAVFKKYLFSKTKKEFDVDMNTSYNYIFLKLNLKNVEYVFLDELEKYKYTDLDGLNSNNKKIKVINFYKSSYFRNQIFLLTSFQIKKFDSRKKNKKKIHTLLCNLNETKINIINKNNINIFEKNKNQVFKCIDLYERLNYIPRSDFDTKSSAQSVYKNKKNYYNQIIISNDLISKFDFILIINVKNDEINESHKKQNFLIAELSNVNDFQFTFKISIKHFFKKVNLILPEKIPLVVNYEILNSNHNFYIYKLFFKKTKNVSTSKSFFRPFVRQWTNDVQDEKWYVNLEKNKVNNLVFQSSSSYISYDIKKKSNLNIEIWSDVNTENESFSIYFKIDILQTFKTLIKRHISFIFLILTLTCFLNIMSQMRSYLNSANYPNFIDSLIENLSIMNCILVLTIYILLTAITKIENIKQMLNKLNILNYGYKNYLSFDLTKNTNFKVNSVFLRIEKSESAYISVYFCLLGLTLLIIFYFLLYNFIRISAHLQKVFLNSKLNFTNHISIKKRSFKANSIFLLLLFNFIVLLLFSSTLKFQVVFLICFTINLIDTITSFNKLEASKTNIINANVFNYKFSVLLLEFFVLITQLPSLFFFVEKLVKERRIIYNSLYEFSLISSLSFLTYQKIHTKKLPFNENTCTIKLIRLFIYFFSFYLTFQTFIFCRFNIFFSLYYYYVLSFLFLILFNDLFKIIIYKKNKLG